MSRFWILLTALILPAADSSRRAPPAILPEGVVNAASEMPSQLPAGAIARGSILRIRGVRLGPEEPAAGTVSVDVRQGATVVSARVIDASETRIDAILPHTAPLGDAFLTVTFDGQTSAPFPIRVVASSFGIFTPTGIVATPGDTVSIRGTGLGSARRPEVLLGGRAVSLRYAGHRPGHPGEDEIRFRIPRDAPQGCFVPVAVRTGSVWSNTGTIAIVSRGQQCADTAAWLDSDSLVLLLRARVHVSILEFSEDLGLGIFAHDRPDQPRLDLMLPPAGVCTAYNRTLSTAELNEWLKARTVNYTDAGPVDISGPRGTKGIVRRPRGPFGYWNTLGGGIPGPRRRLDPLFLEPGTYRIRSVTVKDLPEFHTETTVPPAVEWTNLADAAKIDRRRDFTFTWKSAAAEDRILVAITNLDQATGAFGLAMCVSPGDAGRFTVPARMMANLPAVTGAGQFPLNLALIAHLPAQPPSSSAVRAAYASLEARTVDLR
jgi:uncharacterized protein (TIGR03437 family)